MTQYNPEALKEYERRIAALEESLLTEEEREINKLVIRIVKSIRSTIWLINGGMKYLAAPLGVLWGVWLWGGGIWDWVMDFLRGVPR